MQKYFVTSILRKYQENGHSEWVLTLCPGISDSRLGMKLDLTLLSRLARTDERWCQPGHVAGVN